MPTDDAGDAALIENNGVTSEWLQPHSEVTLFISIVFNETNIANIITVVTLH